MSGRRSPKNFPSNPRVIVLSMNCFVNLRRYRFVILRMLLFVPLKRQDFLERSRKERVGGHELSLVAYETKAFRSLPVLFFADATADQQRRSSVPRKKRDSLQQRDLFRTALGIVKNRSVY